MECNKEEAFRVKEIAEKKFADGDIAGAKRFATKAQNLYPLLDGLPQLSATLDVYMAADKRTNGEVDWYRVLGVEPSADDDTIRRHYKKLALILHPDRSKAVGTDGAFQIVSEAWRLLSDKTRRIAYDQNRKVTDMDQKVPNWNSSVPQDQNGFPNFSNNKNCNVHSQNSAVHRRSAASPLFSKPNTFWTICSSCTTQFEYLRTYLNHKLLCNNCCLPFVAVEATPPCMDGNCATIMRTPYTQGKYSTEHTREENSRVPMDMRPAIELELFPKAGSTVSAPSALSTAQSEKCKRKHEEEFLLRQMKKGAGLPTGFFSSDSSSALKGDKMKKRRHMDQQRANSMGRETAKEVANRIGGINESGSQNSSFAAGRWNISCNVKLNSTRELSQLQIRKMLMEKAKKHISEKVMEWGSWAAKLKTSEKDNLKEREKQKATSNGTKGGLRKCGEFLDAKSIAQTTEPAPIIAKNDDPDTTVCDQIAMIVPDPDFHDFDKDRTEKSFGHSQVWAAYDDDDGMPRYYAMIHGVISIKPFKMRMSWLNTKSNRELGPLNWIDSGFYKTSGEFWIGKHEVNKSLNSFSHRVKWVKGTRGSIQIYPGKGEVWALYRNWSPNWNERTPDEVIHKYDMAEVLEEYSEGRGVTVVPLVKIAGFKTVFRQHPDHNKTRTIPREEMFRFSHQVPSVLLTGQEGHNAPRGCWELDPASTPLELLQVLTEVQLEAMMETAEKDRETYFSEVMRKSNEEDFVENVNTTKEKVEVGEAATGENKEKEIIEGKVMVYKRRR